MIWKICITLVWAFVLSDNVLVIKGDHVSAVRCAENAECLQNINEEIVDMIAENIRPESEACENFWDYACGEWSAAPYYDHVDNFEAVGNYYAQQMQQLLTTADAASEQQDVRNLREQMLTYYKACKEIKSYYLPLGRYFEELAELSGSGLPRNISAAVAAQQLQWSNFNWLQVVARLRRFGVNDIFLAESVGFAFNDTTKYVLELEMPEQSVHFQNRQEFINYLVEFGWIEKPRAEHMRWAGALFDFEKKLQALSKRHAGDGAEQHAELPLTLAQLKLQVPSIDWQSYFDILLGQSARADLPLEVADMAYMRELARLLAQTDDDIVGFYIIMRLCKFISARAPNVTDKNCIEHMGVVMPLGMNYLHSRYLYKTRHEDERVLQQILQHLKLQFGKYLAANKLQLTGAQQRYVAEKLAKMQLRLGNLPTLSDSAHYNHYYAEVALSDTNFYRNHWTMLHFRMRQQHVPLLSALGNSFDAARYYINDDISQVRNAPYFVAQRNLLVVPLLFVRPPFYHHRLHAVLHYSLVGWILAHELNHAFETEGIIFDAAGNESALGAGIRANANFAAAVKCLTRRRPTAALIERIADVNGFQLAYDAYFDNLHEAEAAEAAEYLPFARNFTQRQLYFLNFAQFFCGKLPTPIDHDRDDVRVIEMVANMEEFAQVFGCERGKPENPAEKCEMWRI